MKLWILGVVVAGIARAVTRWLRPTERDYYVDRRPADLNGRRRG